MKYFGRGLVYYSAFILILLTPYAWVGVIICVGMAISLAGEFHEHKVKEQGTSRIPPIITETPITPPPARKC